MKIAIALSIVALTIVDIAKAAQDKPEKAKEETEATPREKKRFKGVNLYARFDEAKNQWHFGMLPSTNRSKDAEEVNQSMTLKGIDALLAEMKRMAPHEEVFLASLVCWALNSYS